MSEDKKQFLDTAVISVLGLLGNKSYASFFPALDTMALDWQALDGLTVSADRLAEALNLLIVAVIGDHKPQHAQLLEKMMAKHLMRSGSQMSSDSVPPTIKPIRM